MAGTRLPSEVKNAWRSAFCVTLGIILAIVVVLGVFAANPRTTSVQPPWPSSYPFGLGSNGRIAPFSFGWGSGTGTSNNCQFLFVEFNATLPAEIWVIPGGATVVFHNETPYFSSILWFSGPAVSDRDAIELPHGGGYGIWTANPGPEETWLFVSDETEACL